MSGQKSSVLTLIVRALFPLATVVMLLSTHVSDAGQQPPSLGQLEAQLPQAYSAKPIRAQAVERTTGFPLDGVNVVARWGMRHVLGGHLPALVIQETVTDAEGRFVIPGFEPRSRPKSGVLYSEAPQILLFKRGFVSLVLRNDPDFARRYPNYRSMSAAQINALMMPRGWVSSSVQKSFWDEMVIDLEAFNGAQDDWLRVLFDISSSLRDEELASVPLMRAALKAERSQLNRAKLRGPSEQLRFDGIFSRLERIR